MRSKHGATTALVAVLATAIVLTVAAPANADPPRLYVGVTNCPMPAPAARLSRTARSARPLPSVVNIDGDNGEIQIFNGSKGTVHVVIDELGYFLAE